MRMRRETRGVLAAWLACGSLLFASAPGSPLVAEPPLRSRVDFRVGVRPVGVLVADLDDDGNLDMVAANAGSDDISLLKGFGDGTFRETSRLAAGFGPSGIAYADVDNDGVRDLVTSNLSLEIVVNPGDGVGGFGPPISSLIDPVAPRQPFGLAVGDWNGDGRLDVAIVDSTSNSVTRLLGDGTGRFLDPVHIDVGDSPQHIISADLNADDELDLAVVNNSSSTLEILHGDASGQFALATTLATGAGPIFLVSADFNEDTLPDIAVANNAGDSVGVYLADGSGGFGGPTVLDPGFGPRALLAEDVDGDGHTDLSVTLSKISGVGNLAILLGDGAGAFAAPFILKTGPVPNGAATGDFDKDGNLDLVVSSRTGNTLSVIPSLGSGAFLEADKITLPFGSFPHALVVADFNNDTNPDVASANQFTDKVSVASGDGAGGFTSVNSANNTGISPFSIVAGDFNRDGDVDLVTANNGDDTLSYLQGSGSGDFQVTNGLPSGCEEDLVSNTVSVGVGEISGDPGMNLDLVFSCETTDDVCTRQGTGGSGSAAFGAALCSDVGVTPAGVAAGAFNLDALEDVAVAANSLDVVQIGLSDGAGSFLDIPTDFPVGVRPKGVARGDLDNDGFLDLVVANSGSSSVSVLLGDGGGVFSFPSIDSPAGLAPTAIALADFNLDGNLDVAVCNTNANDISLLLGDGLGNLSNAGNFGVRDLPIAIDAGDFNRDGRPDLAVADNFTDTITILINQTVGGDPLQTLSLFGGAERTFIRWGLVPGAVYDVIRGQVGLVTEELSSFNLGSVTCLVDDLETTDTAEFPDSSVPPVGEAYFYAVRAVVGGVPGDYTVSTGGKPGIPSSGGCP